MRDRAAPRMDLIKVEIFEIPRRIRRTCVDEIMAWSLFTRRIVGVHETTPICRLRLITVWFVCLTPYATFNVFRYYIHPCNLIDNHSEGQSL